MKEKRKEQKFECNFCHKEASPDLPPDWNEYPMILSGTQTLEYEAHLCEECNGMIISKFLESKIEEQREDYSNYLDRTAAAQGEKR